MSFFFLSPIKGEIQIHLLETIVLKRLEYLKEVFNKKVPIYNEYMVEGSLYDSVGHYMLCTIAILEDSTELTQFIIKAENTLFRHRLKTLLAYDLRCFAKKLLRFARKLHTDHNFLQPLCVVCQHLMLRNMACHVSSACYENCIKYDFKISFKHCLKFLAERQVELNNGIAHIPCSKWKSYLCLLFETNLKNRLSKTDLNHLKNDPRISELMYKVRKGLFKSNNNHIIIKVLKSDDVEKNLKYFPPCMLNLDQHLRKKHRLTHDQRFIYSLFLKDIGMPIDEALIFWRKEYEKVPKDKATCCHNWKTDENKFVYGIRHMYGLEGRRKEYMCRGCQQIQYSDMSYSEGGCPFKSFDEENLLQILNIQKDDQYLSQINALKVKGMYSLACKLYLQNRILNNTLGISDENYNLSPVKYYTIASKCNTL